MVPYGLASHLDQIAVGSGTVVFSQRRCPLGLHSVRAAILHPLKGATVTPCCRTPNPQNAGFLPGCPTVRGLRPEPPFCGLRAQQYFTKVTLWISRSTVREGRPDSGVLCTLSLTVRDKKLRPSRDVKSQHECCEARCGVGAGKTQQCRFPANFELSAGFFRVCKNGLFLSHTVRRQGGAVFRRCGEKDSTKLS